MSFFRRVAGVDLRRGSGLDPQRRGSGLDPQRRGSELDAQRRGSALDPQRRGSGLDPQRRGSALSPQRRGSGLSPQRFAGGLYPQRRPERSVSPPPGMRSNRSSLSPSSPSEPFTLSAVPSSDRFSLPLPSRRPSEPQPGFRPRDDGAAGARADSVPSRGPQRPALRQAKFAGDSNAVAVDPKSMLEHVRSLRVKLDKARSRLERSKQRNDVLLDANKKLEAEVDELIVQKAKLLRRGAAGGTKRANMPVGMAGLPPGLGGGGGGGGGEAGGDGGGGGEAGGGGRLADQVELIDLDDELGEDDDGGDRFNFESHHDTLSLGLVLKWLQVQMFSLEKALSRRLPILRAVVKLRTRYGASMAVYFSFCAWLQIGSMFQLVVYAPLMGKHLFDLITGALVPGAEEGRLPETISWLLYSSWPREDAALYAMSISISLILTVFTSARKYLHEQSAVQYAEVNGIGADKMRFARTVLNGWDNSVVDLVQMRAAQRAMVDRLRLLLDEDERAERIRVRSTVEKARLRARRLFGIVLSIAYTLLAWATILTFQLNAIAFATYLDASLSGLGVLASIAIAFMTSAINATLPLLTHYLTQFERWDFPVTVLRVQTARLYAGKILNLLISVAGLTILLFTQRSERPGVLILPLQDGKTFDVTLLQPNTSFGCAENQIGSILVLFVVVEFSVSKILELTLHLVIYPRILPVFTGKPWRREPFPTAQKVINVIYFQALIWLCAPYFPFVTVFAPFALLATFKFDEMLLASAMAKPSDPWAAEEVGALFFRIYFTTFAMSLGWNYLFLRVSDVHFCGPHAAETSAWAAAENLVLQVNWLGIVYGVLSNALFLWVVIGTAFIGSVSHDQHKEMLRDYAEVRISQLSQQALLLDAKVRRQEGQIAALNRQQGRDHRSTKASVVAATPNKEDKEE